MCAICTKCTHVYWYKDTANRHLIYINTTAFSTTTAPTTTTTTMAITTTITTTIITTAITAITTITTSAITDTTSTTTTTTTTTYVWIRDHTYINAFTGVLEGNCVDMNSAGRRSSLYYTGAVFLVSLLSKWCCSSG